MIRLYFGAVNFDVGGWRCTLRQIRLLTRCGGGRKGEVRDAEALIFPRIALHRRDSYAVKRRLKAQSHYEPRYQHPPYCNSYVDVKRR